MAVVTASLIGIGKKNLAIKFVLDLAMLEPLKFRIGANHQRAIRDPQRRDPCRRAINKLGPTEGRDATSKHKWRNISNQRRRSDKKKNVISGQYKSAGTYRKNRSLHKLYSIPG